MRDNGILKWPLSHLPFTPLVQDLILIPPGQMGGNHKHPRKEFLFSLTDGLVFFWQDEKGFLRSHPLRENENFFLIEILPFTPHALKNVTDSIHIVFEGADGLQINVERAEII